MSDFTVINILDLIEAVGEDEVRTGLLGFSCPLNDEIEHFLKFNAIEFAKRKISITHLVVDNLGEIEAFFTLTHKPSMITREGLSNRDRRRAERYARLDEKTNTYSVSAFLIAQFGKNMGYVKTSITGNELMDQVMKLLQNVQRQVGGGVVFLECEDKAKLLNFYQNEHNRFREYGERYSESDGVKYRQLLRFF